MRLRVSFTQGMQYVHASPLGAHGDLRSTKCLVDGRWRLKLGGLALPSELCAPPQAPAYTPIDGLDPQPDPIAERVAQSALLQ